MDLRICFRVREQRDVDLVLGQGMLKAGWNAHKLNAPGKFLVSSPEHDIPRRARAYLVTDEMVAETSAVHSRIPRQLDEISRNAMLAAPGPEFQPQYESPGQSPEEALSAALRDAPEEGWEIGDLMRITGMTRTTLYRHLREHVDHGRAYQVSRGRWRARTTEDGHDE
jgi:S-DNA-T family DNA segregation ATPase FtsK/SpoIIIE